MFRRPLQLRSTPRSISTRAAPILSALQLPIHHEVIPGVFSGGQWRRSQESAGDEIIQSTCPTTGEILANIKTTEPAELHVSIADSKKAVERYRNTVTRQEDRLDLLRQVKDLLMNKHDALSALVSLELGRLRGIARADVQSFLNKCEVSNPTDTEPSTTSLGTTGIISGPTAPLSAYASQIGNAIIHGNAILWKPSLHASLTSVAITQLVSSVFRQNGVGFGMTGLVIGSEDVGEAIAQSLDVNLIVYQGSRLSLKKVRRTVAARRGTFLEQFVPGDTLVRFPGAVEVKEPMEYIVKSLVEDFLSLKFTRIAVQSDMLPTVLPQFVNQLRHCRRVDPISSSDRTDLAFGPLHSLSATARQHKTIDTLRNGGAQIFTTSGLYNEQLGGCFVRPVVVIVPAGSKVDEEIDSDSSMLIIKEIIA